MMKYCPSLFILSIFVVQNHGYVAPTSRMTTLSKTIPSSGLTLQQQRNEPFSWASRTGIQKERFNKLMMATSGDQTSQQQPLDEQQPTNNKPVRFETPCDIFKSRDACESHDCQFKLGKCVEPTLRTKPTKVVPRPYERQDGKSKR